jgi:formate hydrogenlyase subunit 6/NADH:ubiquinone oxidoreductase subunit I
MKILTEQQLKDFFKLVEQNYDLHVPIRLSDGTRAIGNLEEGPLAMAGDLILQKITSVFFPQMETMLTGNHEKMECPELPAKPILLVGLTAQDADCLAFIDRFYNANYRDDIYCNRREGAVIVCVTGRCGSNGEFLKMAGSKCDIELICDGKDFIVTEYTEAGKSLTGKMEKYKEVSAESFNRLRKESDDLSDNDVQLIQEASRILLEGKVPDEFWQKISTRCIACTSCNLTCPTCTCFDVFDRKLNNQVQRWRIWDSCQLDGFMREASGHNPMGEESMRTRRRIHHKLAADVSRWGEITCFLCGRCDRVCPTGIGIKAVCREIVEQYGSF